MAQKRNCPYEDVDAGAFSEANPKHVEIRTYLIHFPTGKYCSARFCGYYKNNQ
jgi:hypothetical protein